MNRYIATTRIAVLAVLILNLNAFTNASASNDKNKIKWNSGDLTWYSHEKGIQQIKKTGKQGLLVVYADWCPACREHSKAFFNGDIVPLLENLILIKVNVDLESKISQQYDFDGSYIPRVFALNKHSEVMHRLYNTKNEYAYYEPALGDRELIQLLKKMEKVFQ